MITASFTDDGADKLGSGQIVVPAHGHASIVLANVLPDIIGTRGTVSLTSNVPIFGLGIRANGVNRRAGYHHHPPAQPPTYDPHAATAEGG